MVFFQLIKTVPVAFSSLMVICIVSSDDTPPTWPNQFSILMAEETWSTVLDNETIIPVGINTGGWYYDYTHKQMRFDHNKGHFDNFCLAAYDSREDCRLYFVNTSVMYVDYPQSNECCQLCTVGAYCTVLEPNWLQDASYFGLNNVTLIDGNVEICNEWGEQGAVAFDYWLQQGLANDKTAVPCEYWEDIYDHGHFIHTIKFDMNSYVIGPPNQTIFQLPDYCNQMCQNPINETNIRDILQTSRLYTRFFS